MNVQLTILSPEFQRVHLRAVSTLEIYRLDDQLVAIHAFGGASAWLSTDKPLMLETEY